MAKLNKYVTMGALAASAFFATPGFSAMTLTLQPVAGTGYSVSGQNVTINGAGTININLQLVASFTNANANSGDDTLISTFGNLVTWKSTGSGAISAGSLAVASRPAPYTNLPQNGVSQDLSGSTGLPTASVDGVLDLGRTGSVNFATGVWTGSGGTNTDWFRAGQDALSLSYGQNVIANFTLSASAYAATGTTSLQYFLRSGTANTQYREDGVTVSSTTAGTNLFLGAPVVIAVQASGNNSQILIDSADSSSVGTGASSKAINLGNLLLNASAASAVTLNKTGTDATTYTVATGGSATTTLASGNFAGGPQTANGTVGINTSSYNGAAVGTVTIDNTAADSAAAGQGSGDANDVFNVTANVGHATADTDGGFTGGNALTAATGSTLVGLASKVVSGSSVAIQSQAIVLETNDGDGLADGTVSMNWRDRTAAEQQNGNPIFVDPQVNLGSDVVLVSGIGGIYTLRMDYDASDFAGDASEIQAALDGFLYLGYLDAGLWENAGTGAADIDGYSGADFILGKWGVDATNNYVWAVVNHGGEFAAVVPEPASLGVLALGGLALLARRRK